MMKKNTLIGIIGVLLIAALAGVTYLLFNEKQANREMQEEFKLEKEDLENDYTSFVQQYDELKMTVANDSLAQLLEQEQLKTQRLLEELRTVKTTNATEIRRLKNELATLRKVMVGYVNQIDSLNRLTEQQRVQIAEVTEKYEQASRQVSSLSEERKNLTKQVTLAAQLDATNISVFPQNKRGKEAKKVKDVQKLRVSFSIARNITAQAGEKTVYVRISKPDNDVLTKDRNDTFTYENRQLAYSIKKYIEYTGEEQAITVYWDVNEVLYAGNYRVDIFADGNLIGSGSFILSK
ncbi:MAG: hypothetical protein IJR07_04600 [Bacteroidaceae bacterium]|nr:hypothetical protein [Bacteroidaceae bacterium]